MCPGTIAIIGAAASAAGSVGGGIASAENANYQGQVARNNSIIEAQNARYAAGAATANTERAGLEARAKDANIKAAAAANGVDVNTGSPANVEVSQKVLGALDVATVANRGAASVYGYASQAQNFESQSKLDFAQAPWDVASGVLGAVGSVAGAAPGLPGGLTSAGSSATVGNLDPGQLSSGFNDVSSSLISGPPNLPSDYSFMSSPENPTDPAELFG